MKIRGTISRAEAVVSQDTLAELVRSKTKEQVYLEFPLEIFTATRDNVIFRQSQLHDAVDFYMNIEFPVQREWDF